MKVCYREKGFEMNTLEQLQELANQGKLAEIDTLCAELQGWKQIDGKWKGILYKDKNGELIGEYHPTADTEAGRSQCWQLMVKGKLLVDIDISIQDGSPITTACDSYEGVIKHENPQIAVAIAFILAAQGEG